MAKTLVFDKKNTVKIASDAGGIKLKVWRKKYRDFLRNNVDTKWYDDAFEDNPLVKQYRELHSLFVSERAKALKARDGKSKSKSKSKDKSKGKTEFIYNSVRVLSNGAHFCADCKKMVKKDNAHACPADSDKSKSKSKSKSKDKSNDKSKDIAELKARLASMSRDEILALFE